MRLTHIRCVVCGESMENLDYGGFQPDNGLAFVTSGHYGSTVFDPMDGSRLELAICDFCLKDNKDRIVKRLPQPTTRPTYWKWTP